MKEGEIVKVYKDHKVQNGYIGTAVLLRRLSSRVHSDLTFSNPEEDDEILKFNQFVEEHSPIQGEFDGSSFSVKLKKKPFTLYSTEYWLVQYIESDIYGNGFRQRRPIRVVKGQYKNLKGLTPLTTYNSTFDEKDIDNELD